jgi:hypothetical protein
LLRGLPPPAVGRRRAAETGVARGGAACRLGLICLYHKECEAGAPARDGTDQENMMKCLICGRTCLPGAKLCSDCSSARKRAFAATVTQPLLDAAGRGRSGKSLLRPSQSVAATARRTAERSLSAKPPVAEPEVPASRRMDLMFLVAGLVVVMIIGAYIARQIQKSREAAAPQFTEQAVSAPQAALPNAVSIVPAGMSPKNVAETRPPELTATMPTTESTSVPAKRSLAKQRIAPVEAAPPPVEPAPPPTIAVAPMPPPVPEVREAPRPDALQLMNEGLARCASGDLFGRILCDQRVRREYCDGRWGQVPQCPSGVANDHGQ